MLKDKLEHILQEMTGVVVAFSGGTDSSLLLKVAHDVLGDRAVAVTAVSPSLPAHERAQAQAIAQLIGARHVLIESQEMRDPRYAANTPQRCYFCKLIVFGQLMDFARREGYRYVIDGSNVDDLNDYRPGRQAAEELGIRSPLQEAGFAKADIRRLARELGLPNWDRPASACLASRIPYGIPITPQTLGQIEQAELVLRQMGLGQLRVRHHGQLARIEVEPPDMAKVLAAREQVVGQLAVLGYTFVTLDLAGFRSGSLNRDLTGF